MLEIRYRLTQIALVLVSVVVILGAFTRLTDAGLGCPDWPGCYGFLTVPTGAEEVAIAEMAFPERPVEASKARNEMVHRYFAGSLGVLVLLLWVLSLRAKQHVKLATTLLATVTFQAVLGMWTVTMNLMPLVVMGHLLGGFTTFCLILLLFLRLKTRVLLAREHIQDKPSPLKGDKLLLGMIKAATLVVVLQIALGGWTAANYAAVACTDLPICEPGWQEKFDLSQALSVPTGHADYEFGVFPFEARMSIHVLHRFGAILATSIIALLLLRLWQNHSLRPLALGLGSLTLIQISLGVSNVVFHLPLAVAVAHNFVGLLLLGTLVITWYLVQSRRKTSLSVHINSSSQSPQLPLEQGA